MTLDEVLKELHRELDMRVRVYPRWVAEDKLSRATADHRILAIRQAIEVIEGCKPPEPIQISLFEVGLGK